MNTCSTSEHIMFAPAQFLRTWLEQCPSNQGDPDSSDTGEVGSLLYGGGPAFDLIFFYNSM